MDGCPNAHTHLEENRYFASQTKEKDDRLDLSSCVARRGLPGAATRIKHVCIHMIRIFIDIFTDVCVYIFTDVCIIQCYEISKEHRCQIWIQMHKNMIGRA
jgi:hypothetical protein